MKMLMLLLVLGMLVGGVLLSSDRANAQQYPQVAGLTPFTAEANYMSLPGYLRWQVFVEQGRWIARSEAVQLVAAQLAAGPAQAGVVTPLPREQAMTQPGISPAPRADQYGMAPAEPGVSPGQSTMPGAIPDQSTVPDQSSMPSCPGATI